MDLTLPLPVPLLLLLLTTTSVYVGRPPLALKGTRGRGAEAERGGTLAAVGARQEQGSEHASVMHANRRTFNNMSGRKTRLPSNTGARRKTLTLCPLPHAPHHSLEGAGVLKVVAEGAEGEGEGGHYFV